MTVQPIVLLVTSRPAQLGDFCEVLASQGKMTVVSVGTASEAVAAVKKNTPVMAVVDDQVGGVAGLDVIKCLIKENAFIQTAVVSELVDSEFHHRSEGLGVLCKLPLVPGNEDALKLLNQLEQVGLVRA